MLLNPDFMPEIDHWYKSFKKKIFFEKFIGQKVQLKMASSGGE